VVEELSAWRDSAQSSAAPWRHLWHGALRVSVASK
jgi:hypothetical protein